MYYIVQALAARRAGTAEDNFASSKWFASFCGVNVRGAVMRIFVSRSEPLSTHNVLIFRMHFYSLWSESVEVSVAAAAYGRASFSFCINCDCYSKA